MVTWAPASARRVAMAAPMPLAAPVTSAALAREVDELREIVAGSSSWFAILMNTH